MAKTDLERVSTPERQAKKEKILRLIKQEKVEYVYCEHISITGRIVGKGVPSNHFGEIVDKGYQLVYGSVADLFMDRYGNYIGFGAHESELLGMPDLDTFRILPWDRRVARVYCDCYDSETGDVFDADCRSNLKRVVAEVEKELRARFLVGIEPEMMWLKEDANGHVAGVTKPYCYHIAQFEVLRPVFMDVIGYAKALGLDMIQGDHEDAPGQLELNIHHDRALATADNITTYRHVCSEVARQHGLIACFMPKPFVGVSANGHHHHFSMEDDKNQNIFYDPKAPGKMSQRGRWFLGGILKHADALCALTASTVNSYKRFLDSGFWAPLYKDWGWQNRTSVVRVAAPGRFEYRAVDSAVNPYLSLAAMLAAGRDGMRKKIDPGPPQQQNVYEIQGREKHLGKTERRDRIPLHLGEALAALAKDEVIKEVLPGRLYNVFTHYKTDEWERYLAHVSDWEFERYLTQLP
jgi:glutamine synthetase